jgi:hypothetical protein
MFIMIKRAWRKYENTLWFYNWFHFHAVLINNNNSEGYIQTHYLLCSIFLCNFLINPMLLVRRQVKNMTSWRWVRERLIPEAILALGLTVCLSMLDAPNCLLANFHLETGSIEVEVRFIVYIKFCIYIMSIICYCVFILSHYYY